MTPKTAFLTVAVAVPALLGPTLSPGSDSSDGQIAFVNDWNGRDAPDEIYVMNADGSDPKRLTVSTAGNNLFPIWSPDGKHIAFNSDRTGVVQTYLMNADGSGLTQLTTGGGGMPTWAPNGSRISFTGPGAGEGGARDILVINVDGTGLRNLTNTPANEQGPAWSPDGSKIAFNSNRDGDPEIYVMNADGTGEPVQLTVNGAPDVNAEWSPDGRKIAFESQRDGNREIYVMNVDGTGQMRLTSDPRIDGHPSWSPDGRKIAFESQRDGNREIYVMNADGTGQMRLTSDPRIDGHPSWSPDGRRIAFERQLFDIPGLRSPNGSEIFVINADGTNERQVTHRAPASFSAFPSWGPGHP